MALSLHSSLSCALGHTVAVCCVVRSAHKHTQRNTFEQLGKPTMDRKQAGIRKDPANHAFPTESRVAMTGDGAFDRFQARSP